MDGRAGDNPESVGDSFFKGSKDLLVHSPSSLLPRPWTQQLRSSSADDLVPSFFVFLSFPLLSFSSSAVLRSSLQGCPKNPLLLCCFLSLARGNSRDKHTSLPYKTMATLVTDIFNAYRRVASGRVDATLPSVPCFSLLLRRTNPQPPSFYFQFRMNRSLARVRFSQG